MLIKKLTKKELKGVEFFTSHYGNLGKIDLKTTLVVSISGGKMLKELKKTYGKEKGEEYFYLLDMMLGSELGPSWKIYSTYKNSTKPKKEKEEEYYRSFIYEVLAKVDLKKLILDISETAFKQGKDKVVFLCYEKPNEFCHRFILAEDLDIFVLQQKVNELLVGDKRQVCFRGRLKLGWYCSQRFFLLWIFFKIKERCRRHRSFILKKISCYNLNMIRAKKTLGQNFLKNKDILRKIVESGNVQKDEVILEIGPGKGALTEFILAMGNKVKAIEKDNRLIPILEEKFSEEIKSGQFELFEGDALEVDYKKIGLTKKKFSVIANLPYYITGKFLSLTLENKIQPEKIILMLQKEIVERITGEFRKNGKKNILEKENILSVSIKVYGEPKFITTVSKKNFTPEPSVDSAVLGIYNISKNFFTENNINEKEFFDFVKLSFSSKRKKIIKNLSNKFDKKELEKYFTELNMDTNIRAEDLKVEELKKIFLGLKK